MCVRGAGQHETVRTRRRGMLEDTMMVTSPSELILADDCGLARHFKYTLKLRRAGGGKRSPTMASGTAVHYAVEAHLRNYGGTVPGVEDLVALGREGLQGEFRHDEDGGVANVKKYLPGVQRALTRIPPWFWKEDWRVEEEVEGRFGRVVVRGRPDLVRFLNDEAPTVEVVDLKTTATDPLEFMLWSPQVRIYAAILAQMYPDRLVAYRYYCIPVGWKADVTNNPASFIFTDRVHAETVREIERMASLLSGKPEARYARRCTWCEFKEICMARITGADPAGVMGEMYERRLGREELERRENDDA